MAGDDQLAALDLEAISSASRRRFRLDDRLGGSPS